MGVREKPLKVLVTLEDHLWRGTGGHLFVDGPAGYSAWSQLLGAFDEVILLVRVGESRGHSADGTLVEGLSVSVWELPDYVGPAQYFLNLPELRSRVQRAVVECDAFILRVPGLVARLAWQEIRSVKKDYAVEVLGDPWDAFSPGTMPGSFRPIYRRIATRNMKKICRGAVAALYWNGSVLPRRYPPGENSSSSVSPLLNNVSNGCASEELAAKQSRRVDEWCPSVDTARAKTLCVGFVGSLAQLYKGPDTLLRAASICLREGLDLKVLFVGEGRYRQTMELLARQLSISDSVNFLGQLKFGEEIFDFLDSIDLFVMPSRAEGFPRALHEAMARGCPCIGSDVGGIPELLAADDLVPPNDPEALAQKIMEVTADPQRMKAMSARNLTRAKQFDPEVLREVRRAFYQYVRDHSANNAKSGREESL
jgi:glycosyltransferase involved in cell wall biosynthesis